MSAGSFALASLRKNEAEIRAKGLLWDSGLRQERGDTALSRAGLPAAAGT